VRKRRVAEGERTAEAGAEDGLPAEEDLEDIAVEEVTEAIGINQASANL
jgi:hypothetical protein